MIGLTVTAHNANFDDSALPSHLFEDPYQYLTPDTSLDAARLALIKAHCVIRLVFISGTDRLLIDILIDY